jgi:hypothetical protein
VADTIHVRGEGGTIFEMGLPLPPGVQQRLDAGAITRVNADGTPHAPAAEDPDLDQGPYETPRPSSSANKPDWVVYAVSRGMSVNDANGHTKGELIELFGQD